MSPIDLLIDRNHRRADDTDVRTPNFFPLTAAGQTPPVLWIGCGDSRVPVEHVVDAGPGYVFTHRNIANQVPAEDGNARSCVEFAVKTLKVTDVVVCGHTKCGGVGGALKASGVVPVSPDELPQSVVDWVGPIVTLATDNEQELKAIFDADGFDAAVDRLVELNVNAQLDTIETLVADEITAGKVTLHGLKYRLETGRLERVARPTTAEV